MKSSVRACFAMGHSRSGPRHEIRRPECGHSELPEWADFPLYAFWTASRAPNPMKRPPIALRSPRARRSLRRSLPVSRARPCVRPAGPARRCASAYGPCPAPARGEDEGHAGGDEEEIAVQAHGRPSPRAGTAAGPDRARGRPLPSPTPTTGFAIRFDSDPPTSPKATPAATAATGRSIASAPPPAAHPR